MAQDASFEATETNLHKNIYASYIMGDKVRKPNFERLSGKPFLCFMSN